MNEIFYLMIDSLEKVGLGICLFFMAYFSNMILGTWKNVKIEGIDFEVKLWLNSVVKFFTLILGIGLLTITISLIPVYATYVGINIEEEVMATVSNLVIISGFLMATIKYTKDSIIKLGTIVSQH